MKKQIKSEKRIIKSGFSPNGKQMYKDKVTGRRFIADEDRTLKGYPEEKREEALSLHLEGVGLRSIGRFIGCSHASVINWIRTAAKRLEPLSETLLDESKKGIVEMDEMWHYFKKK
jgi:transposase-like protein